MHQSIIKEIFRSASACSDADIDHLVISLNK